MLPVHNVVLIRLTGSILRFIVSIMNNSRLKQLKIALIINPIAGLGGSVALKGSDGVAREAMALGAQPKSGKRTKAGLEPFLEQLKDMDWLTCPGAMGADVLKDLGIDFKLIAKDITPPTTQADTVKAVECALKARVDLVLFAGGDGTARDICGVVGDSVPVLGIPAGVKIHSSVYSATPNAAGEILQALVTKDLVDIRSQQVRDIDEEAFRKGQVRSRYFGEMKVPSVGQFLQHTKDGSGKENEELVLADTADYLTEHMEPGWVYFIGSGKSTQAITDHLNVESTLLGVDAVKDGELIASDLREQEILDLIHRELNCHAVVSVIGGQGHIFGRGNQQFSSEVIRLLGKEKIQVICTKAKLKQLAGRPLLLDTGDRELDLKLSGRWQILTGYDDYVWYDVTTY